MLRFIGRLLCLLLLSACNPFSQGSVGNQFSLVKQTLFFEDNEVTDWAASNIPQCKLCTLTIESKKMVNGSMRFRHVNNARGDLVVLSATNVVYGFALQTGGDVHAISIKKQQEAFKLTYGKHHDKLIMKPNEKKIIKLIEDRYFVWLRKNESNPNAVNLVFWRATPAE